MRLEDGDDPAVVALHGGGQGRRDLGGMVGVVVHHEHAVVDAEPLEAPGGAAERSQMRRRRRRPHARVAEHGQSGQGVEDVVLAWNAQRHPGELRLSRAHDELAAGVVDAVHSGLQVAGADPDAHDGRRRVPGELLSTASGDEDEQTFGRQQGDETAEDLAHIVEAAVVGVVVELHVAHDGDLRAQEQQASVALVGLGHQPFALAHAGVGADVVELAADDERRVKPALEQHVRDHRGRRRLAVRAGHGDTAPHRHDARQHLRAAKHRQAGRLRRAQLGIALRDGRRDHYEGRAAKVGRVVTDAHRDAGFLEVSRVTRDFEIRAGDAHAESGEHHGDAAHAGAADTHEVHRLREVPCDVAHHLLTPS